MTPEELNPTAEEVDPTTEAIIEAIRAGYLVKATRALWMVFNARSTSGRSFIPKSWWRFIPVEWTMAPTCRTRGPIADERSSPV